MNTLKRKQEYLDDYEISAPATKKRSTGNEGINSLCWEFFCDCLCLALAGPMLKEAPRKFAADLGNEDFKASNGWLESLKKWHSIGASIMVRESGGVDGSVVNDWQSKLADLTRGYATRDIYNMDESGLFYTATSTKTLYVKGQKCSGGKQSKDHLTIALCANLAGDKGKPLVIGKSAHPPALNTSHITHSSLPVAYYSNQKAWMTSSIFIEWLK